MFVVAYQLSEGTTVWTAMDVNFGLISERIKVINFWTWFLDNLQ